MFPSSGALREIDQRGWWPVEVFDDKPGPERSARESTESMKKRLAQTAG